MYKWQWFRDHVDPKQYDQNGYAAHVISKIGSYMSKKMMRQVFMKVTNENLRSKIATAALEFFKSKSKTYYNGGRDVPDVLKFLEIQYTDRQKTEIVNHIVASKNYFYTYAKKMNAQVAGEFAINSEQAVKVFETYHRLLTPETMKLLLGKIENGIENPDVKKIIDETNTLTHLKYNADEVQSNEDTKRELLKKIAYTGTIAKKLDFELDLTLDDIKTLPPVLRFEFMQFAFKSEIDFSMRIFPWSYYHKKYKNNLPGALLGCRKKAKLDNLKMPDITSEQMKEMFFSIALAKNEEVQNWLKKYEKYLEVKQGKVEYFKK